MTSGPRVPPHEQPPEVPLPQNIMETVVKYSRQIAADRVAPHDLLRFAKLAHKGRSKSSLA